MSHPADNAPKHQLGAPPRGADPLAGLRPVLGPPLAPGALGRLGRYELLGLLGRGGFGAVFRAADDVLRREVALKVLVGAPAADPEARERFLREARAAAPIRHENVVQVYAIGADPVPHLVMELVPGGSLQDRIDRAGPLTPEQVARVGAQLARGLAAAHARGVVHRDLKPANVLVEDADGGPRAKLTDFGLARGPDDAKLTQTGAVAGTPMFMSPEQARGDPLDARSDLFSLGAVLYASATGRAPFTGATSFAVMTAVCEVPHAPARALVPAVPAWLSAVIDKLLAKEPAGRYASAAEVADALAGGPSAAPRPGGPSTAVADAVPVPRRRAGPVAAAAAVALVALVAAAVALTGNRRELEPGAPARAAPADPAVQAPPPRAAAVPVPGPTGREFAGALEMTFVRVPKGLALLGGGRGKPGKRVPFDYDFYASAHEVTQGQFARVTGTNPSRFSRTGKQSALVMGVKRELLEAFPVEDVTCNEARAFARALNARFPVAGWEYRLPGTHEWEYACRGGPTTGPPKGAEFDFYFTDGPTNVPGTFAKLKGVGAPRPEAVGSYRPNRLGLYNMHGNVAEWCDDGPNTGPIKGGSYRDGPDIAAAAQTRGAPADARVDGVGFRLILAPIRKR